MINFMYSDVGYYHSLEIEIMVHILLFLYMKEVLEPVNSAVPYVYVISGMTTLSVKFINRNH